MKQLIFTFLTIAFTYAVVIAQENQYQTAMLENIKVLDTAETENTFEVLANNFERIALAENDKWLPYYYAAFSKINQAIHSPYINQIDVLVNKAEDFLEKAETLSPDNSEIYVLKALAYSSRIKVDYMVRGPQYVTKSNSYLRKASSLDAENPRAFYLLGQNVYNTPKDFGGGAEPAKKLFDIAMKYFHKNIESEKTIQPHWGRSSLEELVGTFAQTYNED